MLKDPGAHSWAYVAASSSILQVHSVVENHCQMQQEKAGDRVRTSSNSHLLLKEVRVCLSWQWAETQPNEMTSLSSKPVKDHAEDGALELGDLPHPTFRQRFAVSQGSQPKRGRWPDSSGQQGGFTGKPPLCVPAAHSGRVWSLEAQRTERKCQGQRPPSVLSDEIGRIQGGVAVVPNSVLSKP